MKKNLKVIQINGIRGLFMAFFIITCLIAGFVGFPALITMITWNYLALKTGSLLSINYAEGLLLWAIIAFSIYIFNKRKFIVSFNSQQELTDDEIKEVVSRIKSQPLNHHVILPKDIIDKETKEEIECSTESKD